jgi:nucleotide-binding universal stress UspA family protein
MLAAMAGRIVVGIDGSPTSDQALGWATREAQRRGATLQVVHAYLVPTAVEVGTVPIVVSADEEQAIESRHRALLDAAMAEVHACDPLLSVEPVLVDGPAAAAVLEAADGADLVVVGSRGSGSFSAWMLGSVSSVVSHHAPCPVVVVPHHE